MSTGANSQAEAEKHPNFAKHAVYDPDGCHVLKMFDYSDEDYIWCTHCERVYAPGWYRLENDDLQYCPYEGCGGDAALDASPWSRWVEIHDYPEDPEFGKVYSRFG